MEARKRKEGKEGGKDGVKTGKDDAEMSLSADSMYKIQQTLQIINSYQTLVMEACWIHKKQTNRKQQYQDFWYECGNTGKQLSFSLEYHTKAK